MRYFPIICAFGALLSAPCQAEFRLAVSGGVGLLDTASTSPEEGVRDGAPRNLSLGLSGRYEWKYLALDSETFFAFGDEARVGGDGQYTVRSFQTRGTMVDLRARYATRLGKWGFKLFAGLGGGIAQAKVAQDSSNLIEVGRRLTGAHGVVGLELRPVRWLVLSGDYARSFLTDGVLEVSDGQTIEALDVTGASYERWRGRASVGVGGGFDLGGVAVYRTSNVELGSTGVSTFKLIQVGFELGYRFR